MDLHRISSYVFTLCRYIGILYSLPYTTMAEINLQEIHDLLIDVAREAGRMQLAATPSYLSSGTKKNCKSANSPQENIYKTARLIPFNSRRSRNRNRSSCREDGISTPTRRTPNLPIHRRGDILPRTKAHRRPNIHSRPYRRHNELRT